MDRNQGGKRNADSDAEIVKRRPGRVMGLGFWGFLWWFCGVFFKCIIIMFVGVYEAGVEMICPGKRTGSAIQVELWDLDVWFFCGFFFFLMYYVCGVL